MKFRKILNAYDKATPLGGARLSPVVAAAVRAVLPEAVEMDRYHAAAGRAIAAYAGSEAGAVVHCAAAAITLNIAACMTGSDPEKIARLPGTRDMPRRVLLQAGHAISFGAPVEQMIRLSGARVTRVGGTRRCRRAQIEAALGSGGVAAVFAVESYHTVGYDGVKLPELAAICCSAGVPLVVDAATQELRLAEIMAMGPDLVGCSAHKYFGSTTAGVIAGRADLVRAVMLQQAGIGRGMKPTKEALAGLVVAIAHLRRRDDRAWQRAEKKKIERLAASLRGLPGITVSLSPDPNGCPIWRLRIGFDKAARGWDAAGLRRALQEDASPIYVRIYGSEREAVYLNATELTVAEVRGVGERIRARLSRPNRRRNS